MIGGLLYHEPGRSVDVHALRVMASRVPHATLASSLTQGAVGLFSSDDRHTLRATPAVHVAMEADLTNREELEASVGQAADDSHLIAALYEREGAGFVQRLRGGFALALWDPRLQTLLLAVDPFGIARLSYVNDHRLTAFATRPLALLGVPDRQPAIDFTSLYCYLNFGYVPAPMGAFTYTRRLPPGHVLIVDHDRTRLESYWDVTYSESNVSLLRQAKALYEATTTAVRRTVHGVKNRELGSFLSGGTDSSTVTGLMRAVSGESPNAFSIAFDEDRYNEIGYAEIAARHFSASHYVHTMSPEAALTALPRLVEAYDEPFGNNSALGTFLCAQHAADCGIRTLLAGDGGDEIFGGNERYTTDRIFALYYRLPRSFRESVLEPCLAALPENAPGVLGRAQRYVKRASIPNPHRFYSYEFFLAQERERFLDPAFCAALDAGAPFRVLQEHYSRVLDASELNRLLYLDLKLTIGDNDLLKVTRTAELAGVSVRFPLLDQDLVQLTASWPAHYKVRRGEKRFLFKRAFAELLPHEILTKKKHGFGVPTSFWLKSHPRFAAFARETLLCQKARQRGYFRRGALEELFRLHEADATPYYGDILWTVLMLELWHQRHTDGLAGA